MKAIYVRVSTADQNTERQKKETGVKYYEDKCSGTILFNERPEAIKLLKDIELGKITEVEVSSLSRLGRTMHDIVLLLKQFDDLGINLIIKDLGMSSRPDGKKSKMFSFVGLILANVADMQRDDMLEQQAQAIAIKKAKGLNYHDNKRKKEDTTTTLEKYKSVIKDIKKGVSDAQILKTNYTIFDRNYYNATEKEKLKLKRAISRNTLKKIKKLC